jgi:hypothetical protein
VKTIENTLKNNLWLNQSLLWLSIGKECNHSVFVVMFLRVLSLGVERWNLMHDRLNGTQEQDEQGSGVCTTQSKVLSDWLITREMPKIVLAGIQKIEDREDFASLAFGHR